MKRLELEQLIKNNPPRFKHDCDRCVYLGPCDTELIRWDLYVCPSNFSNGPVVINELIARRSSEYSGYSCGVEFGIIHCTAPDYSLAEALCRAMELGYNIDIHHQTQVNEAFKTITLRRWKAYHKDHNDDAQYLRTINKKHRYAFRKNIPAAQNLLRYETPNPDQISRRSASKFHRVQP